MDSTIRISRLNANVFFVFLHVFAWFLRSMVNTPKWGGRRFAASLPEKESD
jgi:hypothetical protein